MENDALEEIFQSLGRVTIRRMFSGKGIYHDGLILALVVDGELLLKADEVSAPAFEEAGARRWVYSGKARKSPVRMPYWSVPDAAYDDPEEMAKWVRLAYEAALRAPPARGQRK
ncbi:TfoX/Sxy family protein [Ciceribacter ferrooxidans]|uniref:TfoX family protein n=1 Tax=Ciceribacter ferrooxidans TaxID=2509717 RepID=A0A4Q2T2S8_9HYPH|nr:TfoX/Sxy family protein [Ciceribacter ferrooxidans]RYC12291.1 TfoX family protein [Ciceribacter ferrooxidans]